MKKSYLLLSLIILLLACDKIEEGNRSIVVENINAVRPVLLEDFTGQNCINCPRAARRASEIKKALKENLIIVSIHAGAFSTRAYRTEAGTAYQETFYSSNEGYPAGMIDRTEIESNSRVTTNDSKWGTYILNRTQLNTIDLFSMSLACDYNESDGSFTVTSFINGITSLEKVMLQLWVTENNIIDYQRSDDGYIDDYVHNHVLRDAVNGIWGEEIALISGIENKKISPSYSLLGKNWMTENLQIVGFIYDIETKEVLCVKEIPLLNNNN